ncbi:MAG: hypothetical protein V2A78_13865 [bacterium]
MTKEEKEKLSEEVGSILVSEKKPLLDTSPKRLTQFSTVFEFTLLAIFLAFMLVLLIVSSRPKPIPSVTYPGAFIKKISPAARRPAFIPPPELKPAREETPPVTTQPPVPQAPAVEETTPARPKRGTGSGDMRG